MNKRNRFSENCCAVQGNEVGQVVNLSHFRFVRTSAVFGLVAGLMVATSFSVWSAQGATTGPTALSLEETKKKCEEVIERLQRDLILLQQQKAESLIPDLWRACSEDFARLAENFWKKEYDFVLAAAPRLEAQLQAAMKQTQQASARYWRDRLAAQIAEMRAKDLPSSPPATLTDVQKAALQDARVRVATLEQILNHADALLKEGHFEEVEKMSKTALNVQDSSTAPKSRPVVVVTTNLGSFEVELDPDRAPVTTANFLQYVRDKFFDGTIFHRVISNFMIQGGGFTANLERKNTRASIKNESDNGLGNKRGTIAMARTSDPNSATSQFFINVKDNPPLDAKSQTPTAPAQPGYAVFGKVISGMDIVDKIRAVPTQTTRTPQGYPMQDVPVSPVVIQSIREKTPSGEKPAADMKDRR